MSGPLPVPAPPVSSGPTWTRALPWPSPLGGLGGLLRRLVRRRLPAVPATSVPVPRLIAAAPAQPRCTACSLCVGACPTDCIHLEAGPAPWRPDPLRGRQPARFDIDLSACLGCGLCVAACPEEAIMLDTEAGLLVGRDRKSLRRRRDDLLDEA